MDKDQEAQIVNDVSNEIDPVVSDLQKFVKDVVVLVEKVQSDIGPLTGPDKQRIAADIVSGFVKLPFPLNLIKGMVIKLLINYAVHKLNSVGQMPSVPLTSMGSSAVSLGTSQSGQTQSSIPPSQEDPFPGDNGNGG